MASRPGSANTEAHRPTHEDRDCPVVARSNERCYKAYPTPPFPWDTLDTGPRKDMTTDANTQRRDLVAELRLTGGVEHLEAAFEQGMAQAATLRPVWTPEQCDAYRQGHANS